MRLFGWIFVGLVVGALARLLLPGRDPIGCSRALPELSALSHG
jgi:uncharacterized membrane protein YeaQ/YmgE (transglycosylase-associated protein family)